MYGKIVKSMCIVLLKDTGSSILHLLLHLHLSASSGRPKEPMTVPSGDSVLKKRIVLVVSSEDLVPVDDSVKVVGMKER